MHVFDHGHFTCLWVAGLVNRAIGAFTESFSLTVFDREILFRLRALELNTCFIHLITAKNGVQIIRLEASARLRLRSEKKTVLLGRV